MSFPTFAPPIGPSPGTTRKPTFRILEAEFGDGYSQPTPDGYNHIREELSLAWDALTEGQMQSIYGFLLGRGGTLPFYYQPAGAQTVVLWTCDDFETRLIDGVWKITAKFRQSRA